MDPHNHQDGEEAVAALIKVGELPRKPLVVSPGHRVSLRTAVALVLAARAARGGGPVGVPEPIRQADLRSRRAVQCRVRLERSSYCGVRLLGRAGGRAVRIR